MIYWRTMKITLSALLLAGCALAQTPPALTIAAINERPIRTIESEMVPLIEAMPADKMNFAPTQGEFKGVRTFGQQAKHVAAVLYMVGAAAKGEPIPVDVGPNEDGPASVTTKEQIVKYVKDAFAYVRGAAQTLTAENETQMMKSPFGQGQMPKSAIVQIAGWHSFDHYGQMVVYARMNGIVPPASQPAPPPPTAKKK
jgi:uncharacterized damage-inducible protein DinB